MDKSKCIDIERFGAQLQFEATDYEEACCQPNESDFNMICTFVNILADTEVSAEVIEHTLVHLQITLADYPWEYMLQPPHLFVKMLLLWDRARETQCCAVSDVLDTILMFLKALNNGLTKKHKKHIANPISQVRKCEQLRLQSVYNILITYSLMQISADLQNQQTLQTKIFHLLIKLQNISEKQQFKATPGNVQRLIYICKELNEQVRTNLLNYDNDELLMARRMQYILCIILVQNMVINNVNCCYLAELHNNYMYAKLLYEVFTDFSLRAFFPEQIRNYQMFLCERNNELPLAKMFADLQQYEKDYLCVIEILKHPNMNALDIVKNCLDKVHCVAKLQCMQLLKTLLKAINDCLPKMTTDDALRKQATQFLLQLMCIPNVDLRNHVYQSTAQMMKRFFACIMSGEKFLPKITNTQLLEELLLGVPLDVTIVLQLIDEFCNDCDNIQIRKYAAEILLIPLLAYNISTTFWQKYLKVLLPALPLLHGCCEEALTKQLLLLSDPDAGNLPMLAVIQNNCCFLYHTKPKVRSEGLTRLIYILCSYDSECVYLPNMLEISNYIPSDICILTSPLDQSLLQIFNAYDDRQSVFNGKKSLENIMSIFRENNSDKLLCKTALVQLNILLRNWEVLIYFCQQKDYFFVLNALENSLKQKEAINEHTSAAISAVAIIVKVLICDAQWRHELSQNANIYILLLRTVFLYHNDLNVRQDVSLAIFLLIYTNYLQISTAATTITHDRCVELPAVLMNLKCPVLFEKRQNYKKEKYHIFKQMAEEEQYLRCLIASTYCDGVAKIPANYVQIQKKIIKYAINEHLLLTKQDYRLLSITNVTKNIQQLVTANLDVTKQKSSLTWAEVLESQLLLLNITTQCKTSLTECINQQLAAFVNKILQILPKNAEDSVHYEHLIVLSKLCLKQNYFKSLDPSTVGYEFKNTLHNILLSIRHETMTNRVFSKISCLFALLCAQTPQNMQLIAQSSPNIYYVDYKQIFDTFLNMLQTYFKQRDFQRVRCILYMLRQLTIFNKKLIAVDAHSYKKSKQLLQMCFSLNSFSYTGSQLLRDALFIVLQLRASMQMPNVSFKSRPKFFKYLVALNGHQCAEIRALVWCLIKNFVQYNCTIAENVKEQALLDVDVGDSLDIFPYGLPILCLNVLLDANEVLIIQELATHVLLNLLQDNCMKFDAAIELLEQQQFFARNFELLEKSCILDTDQLLQTNHCALLNCALIICEQLLRMRNEYGRKLLEKNLIQKLHDLVKIKCMQNADYLNMCANICQLYALLAIHNYDIVQNLLSQDYKFLENFLQLLNIIAPTCTNQNAIKIMQLYLVLTNDANILQYFCYEFKKSPKPLLKYFKAAFSVDKMHSCLQDIMLIVLSRMLTWTEIFCDALSKPICTDFEVVEYPVKTICIDLFNLFTHIYPATLEQLDRHPSQHIIRVFTCFSLLLKSSPHACQTAEEVHLFDYILNIFHNFFIVFEESSKSVGGRSAEKRKSVIIENFHILIQFLLTWYSASHAIISDEIDANRFTKLLYKIWPWTSSSKTLKLLLLQLTAVVSERSLVIARKYSISIIRNTDCILQQVAKIAKTETLSNKAWNNAQTIIVLMSLRVIMNCCSCLEGRLCVAKLNLIEVLNNLYPFNLKSHKSNTIILHGWLEFWELFSRYAEGSKPIYLNTLCLVINKLEAHSKARIMCLKILRNFCFQPANRTTLISSNEFIHTAYEIISEPIDSIDGFEEKFIIITGIWKLISGGLKFVSIVRNTKLAKKICIFCEQFSTCLPNDYKLRNPMQCQDFKNILDIICNVLSK